MRDFHRQAGRGASGTPSDIQLAKLFVAMSGIAPSAGFLLMDERLRLMDLISPDVDSSSEDAWIARKVHGSNNCRGGARVARVDGGRGGLEAEVSG